MTGNNISQEDDNLPNELPLLGLELEMSHL